MNPTLIPVLPGQLNGQTTHLVDARRLHTFLGVGRDFSNWIKARIRYYAFEASVDFVVIDSPILANQSGRGGDRRSVDYLLTLDMAKELAMVERTPRGREARRYFIACEHQLRQMQQAGSRTLTVNPPALTRGERQAINRQAWAEVSGQVQATFHARREVLIQEVTAGKSMALAPKQLPLGFRPIWAR